ncbi:response regulator [Dongia deserti]|uniref:response regulator n=1 Tax=Dongia deserti TaxID=2268030 RepID=UPI0013C41D42|nr:response regulator [Dongia deserti]
MAVRNRLLIVDDEPSVARVIETVARELGFEVAAIHASEEFETALSQLDPTIICLDITMPDRDGVELIAALAARSYPGKIVVMSGSHPSYIQMSAVIGKTRGLQIAGTLSKPFRRQELTTLLESLMT